MSLLFQNVGGDCTINASGESDENFHFGDFLLNISLDLRNLVQVIMEQQACNGLC